MKRKLLSFVVAFMLLLQTFASAGAIYNLLQGNGVLGDPADPFYDPAVGIFYWSKFQDTDATKPDGGVVMAQLTGAVKSNGGTDAYDSATTAGSFDYKLTIDMSKVKTTFDTLHGYAYTALTPLSLTPDFDTSLVKGTFTITVTYDPTSVTPPAFTAGNMKYVSDDSIASIYTIDFANIDTTTPGTVIIPIIANTTVNDLYTTPSKLDDVYLELTGWTATVHNSTVNASMTGFTMIEETDNKVYGQIDYKSNPTSVTVFKEESHSHGGGGGSTVTPPDNPTKPENPVDPDGNDIDGEYDDEGNFTPNPEAQPKKKGKIPNGYGTKKPAVPDPNYNPGDPIIDDVDPGDTLYPRYVNGEVPERLRKSGKDGEEDNAHYAYIAGYPDGEVKPNNNITREEVTAAFYRLLNDEYREEIETSEQNFPDVEAERWSNESIATMANGQYIVGDTDGNFYPAKPITRAEFAVIASKFIPADAESVENSFIDIDDHWAKDYILAVAGECWIYGYEDERFNPDAYITRAEAMTIINRMLVRYGDVESDYAIQWPDVDKSDWYYQSVIEATTDHKYERKANGWSETWLAY